jgi:Uma2 family endonuclease
MSASRRPVGMTVDEFLAWQPPERGDHRWQLVDGEPVCMAPASENHAMIQAQAARLIGNHLAANRPNCRLGVAPGVVPRVRSAVNARMPDVGVTCAPPQGAHMMEGAVMLLEILSPSNKAMTRDNVWAYATIPTVQEILLLASTRIEAELLRRDAAGAWPEEPQIIRDGQELELASIGFRAPLRDFYATTSLVA